MSDIASNGARVYQAILPLMAMSRPATRKSIAAETELKVTDVDWHQRMLKSDQRIQSPANGVFEVVADQSEGRAISCTYMPGGRCKLEIGDTCIDLSPPEGRMVAWATGGLALSFGK